MNKRITILGSTGSIGKSTLNLLGVHPDKFEVFALTAKSKIDVLSTQCQQFNPNFAVVESEYHANQLQQKLAGAKLRTKILHGAAALQEVASAAEVDYVMASIVGAAGLLPTLAAARAGKRILLANKEALVMSGALFMKTIAEFGAELLPVDSEHNALFQCMPPGYKTGDTAANVDKIVLTASGGPFRSLPLEKFGSITPEQAIAHPNWSMGAKISVDSATMMNKGCEVIEAFWLFNLKMAQIDVIIHPQSIIHSMVCYKDGSMLAQLGSPDMQIPIAATLAWPDRINAPVKKLDLVDIGKLTFESVDATRFPALGLAYAAIQAGGTASTVLNAANEVAVEAFLARRLTFSAIVPLVNEVLERTNIEPASSYDVILEADRRARELANENMSAMTD